MDRKSLLILGGTAEASALARAVAARFGEALPVTTSLAGRTLSPQPVPGLVRSGGFGGPQGLLRYLMENRVDCLIDATHPFAAGISAAARCACEKAPVPRLMLVRPPWRRDPRDRWIEVDAMEAAALIVGRRFARAFLTVGASAIAAFAPAKQVHFLIRLIEPPRRPPPLSSYEIVLGRGPLTLAGEHHLLERHAIDVLVSKASGGAATEAKIVAAREQGLPVVMIRRPPPEPGPSVETIEEALLWLEKRHAVSEERSMR
jgi:precorrin-6A/cobalt-precorrin-6A reductase